MGKAGGREALCRGEEEREKGGEEQVWGRGQGRGSRPRHGMGQPAPPCTIGLHSRHRVATRGSRHIAGALGTILGNRNVWRISATAQQKVRMLTVRPSEPPLPPLPPLPPTRAIALCW